MKYFFSILLAGIIGGLIVLFSVQYITEIQEQLSLQPVSQNQSSASSETLEALKNTKTTTTNSTQHNLTTASQNTTTTSPPTTNTTTVTPNRYANAALAHLDFTQASEKTLPTVVHITAKVSLKKRRQQRSAPNPFDFFWGDPWGPFQPPSQQSPRYPDQLEKGSGSGVIISTDGYIVTNNHVIEEADEIEIVLNDKRSYQATVVGTDPSTDIALLKIDEQGLTHVEFTNSDEVKVGQWVLAVGNPFNLESTVTAGIVSAKARNINILEDNTPIESFIQTDAAVNPGNSGGALVNLNGHLVGINTAIATPTGVYAGYSFAVPSNIVAKVVEDLQNYGMVQRAFLGTFIRAVDGKLAKEWQLPVHEGVLVDSLMPNSAAEVAGIQSGDIIVQVDTMPVKTVPELLGQIGSHRPGDEVQVTVIRETTPIDILVRLKNKEGKEEIVRKEDKKALFEILGVELQSLTEKELEQLEMESGVVVTKLFKGKVQEQTDIKEGFIITKINDQFVYTVEEVQAALQGKEGGVLLEGKYPDTSGTYYYAFGL